MIKEVFFKDGDLLLRYRGNSDRDYSPKYRDNSDTDTTYIHTVLDKIEFTDSVDRADLISGTINQAARYDVVISLMRALTR